MKTYYHLDKALANPEDVKVLHLRNRRLKELPEEIGTLKNVEKMNLSGNNIKDLPDSFAQLKKLKSLKMQQNGLEKVPEVLLKLPQLEWLSVRYNRIRKLPQDIHHMQGLVTLLAYSNRLQALPANIAKMPHLTFLNLGKNPGLFLMQLCLVLADMPHKFVLKLGSCDILSLPPNFFQLQQMEALDISGNNELDIDQIISKLEQLPNFKYLRMNHFDGEVSQDLNKLRDEVIPYLLEAEERRRQYANTPSSRSYC